MNSSAADLPAPGAALETFIAGPAGRLEALVAAPRLEGPPRGCVICCHPHPLFGGAMSNKVVYTLAAAALKCGWIAARFNFRGVGRSTGLYDEARGETEDVHAVAAWLCQRLPAAPLMLAGFSFGAYVSLKAAAQLKPVRQISIAPPFGRYVDGGAAPPHPGCPWLVVHSRDDEVVSFAETRAVLAGYRPPPRLVEFDGAGHFFHGRLGELQQVVVDFMQGKDPVR